MRVRLIMMSCALLFATLNEQALGQLPPLAGCLPTTTGVSAGWSVDHFFGDVTNDGLADCAMGDPGALGNFGSVSICSIPTPGGGLPVSATQTLTGLAAGDRFGHAIMTRADLNNDGFNDLVVSAPGFVGGGLVIVWDIRNGAPLWFYQSPTGALLGWSLSRVDDLNGDGTAEVLVGDPLEISPAAGVPAGSVTILNGATGQLLALPGLTNPIYGPVPNAYFGFSLASRPNTDFNGDNTSDFAAGAPNLAGGLSLVYGLSGATGAFLTGFASTQAGDGTGWSVDIIADADADGIPDIVAGAPFWATLGTVTGAFHLIGGALGNQIAVTTASPTTSGGELFGTSVSRINDFSGDGVQDFVVGAPGAIGLLGVAGGGSVTIYSGAAPFAPIGTPAISTLGPGQLGFSIKDTPGLTAGSFFIAGAPTFAVQGFGTGAALIY